MGTAQQRNGALDEIQLRERVRAPWGSTMVDGETVSAAVTASTELGRAAYEQGERSARRRAESILYFLNMESCFAPPTDPIAGLVWSTLMHAKLSGLRREFGGLGAELDAEEMEPVLAEAVKRWGAHNHPVLDDLDRAGDLDAYLIWAKNWFGSCYGFALQLASLVQRTTGDARKAVLENLQDEFDQEVTHDALRIRFYEGLGLSHSWETAVDDPDWVLEATELLNLRTGLCNLRDPMPALGCLYSVEVNWTAECRRHHAIHKSRGFDDHVIQYWTTHASADEHHSSDLLNAIKSLCHTRAQVAAAVEGAIIQLRLRWRMYDSIRERILATAAS
jgi:pyrroloquinoline quinone (PQQ) biosynthesis protein C